MCPQLGQRTDAKYLPQFRQDFSFWPTSWPQLSQKKRGFLLIGGWGWSLRAGDITRYSFLFSLFFLLFSLFFFLLFVGDIKTGAFENYSNSARDKTAYFFSAFRAFLYRLVAHRLKNLEAVAAFFTFVFVCGHGHTIAKTGKKVKLSHLSQGAASL